MTQETVTIYSTPSCVYCNSAKKFFTERGVAYTEYNVADDIKKREEMTAKSGQMGVPVITIGSRTIIGFNQSLLEEALGGVVS
ncbi:MAG: NrdH-redoxin [Candidatus Taylorbacteria bacterium RIFCSPHIGHO2_02_FULL_47_18]|uniref:NrdH-redoxin n=1 Tax=Candidatus Taylorbacteria bacterium RIFCSPLOWO2_01_FULL_48_100 TaxID=1802322 RepID=A0A1G2NEB2_9BACT|nr:MAG: NrdH-redoxin [Candidatus Taylorbacteria bacterium RIFCSPHIGHO2_01_FULL_48_38]OHA28392.1 MAG: NrdH-redoxin [Candidatus Taylorbacteria bacterium RIFCSPHIGHO2_02_FULL_47_18]OHA34425.1 MAG: NrdH-redoxin [Candidatus Taylorbacteria bacterium RIFCSPLOWO2_01_FULL_48_100]OHA40147.1 MAG: NrdH-redoxin [Candidatus Taylorbacteria bacterium RIFCSPLOWO2_02_FULL_48_16]OHA45518.1 MAG: NrdH-redoxin [Candidatus Taylorbacteria bacterium RIFCSPLOWO2_12_FULL_48_11]